MIRRLVISYIALMGLLTITVVSTFIPLGFGNTVINLAIAFAKAGIILMIFMALVRGGALIRLTALTAGFWLLVMFALSWVDLRGV